MFKELLRHNRHSLDPLFAPASIAVIGASATPGKVGHQVLKNLVGGGFSGVIYPVNPTHKAILGIRCFRKLSELPEPVELALICTASHRVLEVLEECIAAKVPAVIILTAGFGELGEEGKAQQEKLQALVRTSSTRLVGPNCLGVINPLANLNATFAAGNALPGRLALVSQSGALVTSILDWSLKTRIGFRQAAVALNYFAYNFIRIHGTLRTSPAMAAGITNRLWEVSDLVALWEAGEARGERAA